MVHHNDSSFPGTPTSEDTVPPCQQPTHSLQVLLVSSNFKDYLHIQDLIASSKLALFKLDWTLNYHQALAKLATRKYDICLIDEQLGSRSGMEMLREIQTADHTVILLTEDPDPTIAMKAMTLGAAYTLQKDELSTRLLERSILYAIHQEQRVSLLRNLLQEGFKQAHAVETAPPPPILKDGLTNLPDRYSFLQQIWCALGNAKHQTQTIGLLWITVDRLKEINANHGWELGDGLLQAIGERLRQHVHTQGNVARLGGEAFGILLPHLPDEHAILPWLHSILTEVSQPYWVQDQAIHIHVRVGVALAPQHSRNPNDLLAYAQAANHTCQQHRQQFYQIYNPDLSTIAMERKLIEVNLPQALERSQFQVYYQPQIDPQTRELLGMEALLRWHHPELGDIPPANFIPVAEETGLIEPLSRWVLQNVCTQTCHWQRTHKKPIHVSVNLSARQLQQDNLLAMIQQVLTETQFDPRQLVLELTETSLVSNLQAAIVTLQRLREWGIRIAIDDFGIGFSSLYYLSQLPIDILKIDQSFIQDYEINPKAASIISHVIAMAKSLQLQVIAEGVETQPQFEFLKAKGCNAIQGNIYSPAQPMAEMMPLFSKELTFRHQHSLSAN
jgi:diguanylate cyclase